FVRRAAADRPRTCSTIRTIDSFGSRGPPNVTSHNSPYDDYSRIDPPTGQPVHSGHGGHPGRHHGPGPTEPAEVQQVRERLNQLRSEVGKAVVGQEAAVTGLVIALLAGGHVLLEGVPGVAKTLLVRTLSATL